MVAIVIFLRPIALLIPARTAARGVVVDRAVGETTILFVRATMCKRAVSWLSTVFCGGIPTSRD